jgi:hypothetical protein
LDPIAVEFDNVDRNVARRPQEPFDLAVKFPKEDDGAALVLFGMAGEPSA